MGPLQVNSFWVSRLAALTGRSVQDIRFWLINDPCFNVQAARWIFLSGLSLTRDYWKAVGVYHSPTSSRQRRYIESVSRRQIGRASCRERVVSTCRSRWSPFHSKKKQSEYIEQEQ